MEYIGNNWSEIDRLKLFVEGFLLFLILFLSLIIFLIFFKKYNFRLYKIFFKIILFYFIANGDDSIDKTGVLHLSCLGLSLAANSLSLVGIHKNWLYKS